MADNVDRQTTMHLEHFRPAGDTTPYIQIVGEPADRASLFMKLAQLNKSLKKIKHTGNFDAGNTKYSYATESDVIEPIAAVLGKVGLATVPNVVEQWWHDIPSKYNINRVCTVHAQLLIGDTDTGAYIVAHTYSTAANGDKASNAAFTTAIKYLLAKLTLVAFGDDADEYSIDGKKAAAPRSATKAKLDALHKKVKEAGAEDAVKKYLKDNTVSWSKMTEQQVQDVEKIIEQGS
jgi:hypothetical protein